jgi:hypothetical protein
MQQRVSTSHSIVKILRGFRAFVPVLVGLHFSDSSLSNLVLSSFKTGLPLTEGHFQGRFRTTKERAPGFSSGAPQVPNLSNPPYFSFENLPVPASCAFQKANVNHHASLPSVLRWGSSPSFRIGIRPTEPFYPVGRPGQRSAASLPY